jgi:hypothetical protein
MNDAYQSMAANAICHAAEMVKAAWQEVAGEHMRPFYMLKPAMSKDGNQWCFLYGENLQEGVAGFGDTPAAAAYDFDKNWNSQKIPSSGSSNSAGG